MTEGFMDQRGVELKSRPSFFVDFQSQNARQIFAALDMDLVKVPSLANLVWLRYGFSEIFPTLTRGQLINHFAHEGAMINKGRLTANLNARKGVDFYPDSYRLYDQTECKAFFDQLPDDDDPEQIWILKPANLSKGVGMRILREFDGLRKQFQEGDLSEQVVSPDIEYIAQRYIAQPLLLEGKKSEIRVYWMIASVDPLRVLMFDEGTVRLTTQPYSLDDLDNPLMHLTNIYQQKLHGDSDKEVTLKWTFEKLQRYLSDDLRIVAPNFLEAVLKPRIRVCLKEVVDAVIDELRDTQSEATCFGVYGADLILDASLKPWLTEIQKNPGLSHDDPVKINVIPELLREAVQIAFASESGDWHDLPRRFEWIIGP
ncbi:MAG: tubulin--tyrosine ligase family protein [Gammaproteobacteria bacterium]|nr:tubulin--tyrosine ligase family protein [Gammaproteobacteria bacterium]